MAIETTWRVWNLRYLERIIAVTFIVVFISLFIGRAARVDAELERASVELVVQDLQSRVMMFTAEQRILGHQRTLVDYIGANPVGLVIDRIGDYAGEFDRLDWNAVAPGQWAFEHSTGELDYRIVNEDFADTALTDPKRIRYRLAPQYTDRNGNRRFDAGTDLFIGLRFDPVDTRPWQLAP